MSADNGIYLHKFPEGWKVCHTQAIENIFWLAEEGKYNEKYLNEYFKDSPVFKTREEASIYAWKLYDEIMKSDFPIIEYGISEV